MSNEGSFMLTLKRLTLAASAATLAIMLLRLLAGKDDRRDRAR